ncbi:MAG: hypothetical protein Q8N18_22055 [Opitutaceae bacterium]|nr:hypothetical protein [Opitutaceae bacterium]
MNTPSPALLGWRVALLALAALAFAGCGSTPAPRDYTPVAVRFHLESNSGDGTPVALPNSGLSLLLNSKPVLTEGDVVDVDLVQVDLGRCLYFQLTPAATRDFYRLSVSHQGRRLVLLLDGIAMGARLVDGPITNGAVFIFIERPDEELPALVANLKKSSVAMQREIARRP